MTTVKKIDTNTNSTTSTSKTTTAQRSHLKLNLFEQRVYKMAHKHFTRIDTEADRLENGLLSLTKKLSLVSSQLSLLQNEINTMEGSSKVFALSLISAMRGEFESVQAEIDKLDIKLKNIIEHPLHKLNRKQFLGELETSYNDYIEEIECVDNKDPCDYCFFLAEQGVDLSGIIKAVKQADKIHKQNNLENKLKVYASSNDRANYIDTYAELCKNYSDATFTVTINAKKYKIAVNSAALKSLLSNSEKLTALTITLPIEYEEGLEKVYTFLTHLDPTELRATKQTEAIAIFRLCHYWGITKHEADIFHHFTEADLADESLFTLACKTNNHYLLQKSIRGFLQQAAKSDEDYKNVNKLFIENKPPIEKLDLTNLDLSDSLIELLKSCTNMRELSLSGNKQLTDKSLFSIAGLTRYSTFLSIHFLFVFWYMLGLIGSKVAYWLLSLLYASGISPSGIEKFLVEKTEHRELRNLTTLNLRGCTKLTKEGLKCLEELKLTSLTWDSE